MIDPVVIERSLRDANPIRHVDDLDAEEFASFLAAARMKRAAIMQTPARLPTRPAPAASPMRRRRVLAFAAAFVAVIVGIGVTTFVRSGDELSLIAPDAAGHHLEPVALPFGEFGVFARSGDTLWAWNEEGGVASYVDGAWHIHPSLPGSVADVAGSPDGEVWAITTNGRGTSPTLWRLEAGVWRRAPEEELLPTDTFVEQVEVDEATGLVWFGTDRGVYRWNGEAMNGVGSPPNEMVIDQLASTGDGSVWASRFNPYFPESGGLARYDADTETWEKVRPLGGDLDLHVTLAPTPNGNLWALLADFTDPFLVPDSVTLAYFDSSADDWIIHDLPEGMTTDAFAFTADDGGVWLALSGLGSEPGTEGAGLARFDGQTWWTYPAQVDIDRLGIGREPGIGNDGTLWVSAQGGTGTLYRFVSDTESP